jgi:hypothetical protein
MGSGYRSEEFDGNLTREQLSRRFAEFQSQQEYEYGHGSYNGTLSTTGGLKVEDRVFDSRDEADRHIADNTQKWGAALAVKFKVTKVAFKKEPTYNGKKRANTDSVLLGFKSTAIRTYWCDSQKKCVTVAADQCSATQKARLLKLQDECESARVTASKLRKEFRELVRKFEDIEWEPTAEDYRRFKSVRPELRKAEAKAKKAKERFVELDRKLGERLFGKHRATVGIKWVVGGWCAE